MQKRITYTDDAKKLAGAKAPLYCKYDGQIQAQPAYVQVDPRGDTIEIDADYSGEIGNGIPALVWEGVIHRFPVPSNVNGKALWEFINDQWFIETIRGFLNAKDIDKIIDIECEICDKLAELQQTDVWDAGDWFSSALAAYDSIGETRCHEDAAIKFNVAGYTVRGSTSDSRIKELAAIFEAELDSETMVIGIDKYLLELRDTCKQNVGD